MVIAHTEKRTYISIYLLPTQINGLLFQLEMLSEEWEKKSVENKNQAQTQKMRISARK